MALIVWIILALIFIIGSTIKLILKDKDCPGFWKAIFIGYIVLGITALIIWG